MSNLEFSNEIAYYFTKRMLQNLKDKSIITTNDYELIKARIRSKYEPYFDILSD